MATAGLYRRVLPCPPAIDFSSAEGKAVFREALEDGTMEGFFQLIAHFQTQAEPAFCGLASLAVVLNALSIDPLRTWKGIWRWYDEWMLECCLPLEKVKAEGITFGKVACAGQCAGASVTGIRANTSSLTQFRHSIKECTSSTEHHMIVSYDRRALGQSGAGHFSPIGGYNSGRDLALILDVARFKYPPHWVPLPLLWDAVNTLDPATGNWRGFLLATKPTRAASVLFTLSCKDELWKPILDYMMEKVPDLLRSIDIQTPEQALSVAFRLMPGDVTCLVKWIVEVERAETVFQNLGTEAAVALNSKVEVLSQLRQTTVYRLISQWKKRIIRTCPEICPLPCCSGEDVAQAVHSACRQGAAAFSGIRGLSDRGVIGAPVTTHVNDVGKAIVVTGHVALADGSPNKVDVLLPAAPADKCSQIGGKECLPCHPLSADLLSIMILALPPATWSGLTNKRVRAEMADAVSTTNLPKDLRSEVENLREQFYLVYKWCGSGGIEQDSELPDLQNVPIAAGIA